MVWHCKLNPLEIQIVLQVILMFKGISIFKTPFLSTNYIKKLILFKVSCVANLKLVFMD